MQHEFLIKPISYFVVIQKEISTKTQIYTSIF